MPCQFNRLGISFQYPENWTLDEEDTLAEKPSVTVYSPGGAFWSVSVHPRSADPARLAKAVVEAMSAEYEDLDSEAAQETVGGRSLVGYDLTFFFLDFTNTAAIRCVQTERATLVVFCQAEDHEYDAVRRVFLAMTTSLLDGGSG
jgi:hypothetical protein